MSSLFRTEAVAAQQDHFLGTIRIGRPPSFALVTAIAIACALALIAFAAWGEVTRKARLPGLLSPTLGSLQVIAAGSGVLLDVHVHEGDTVRGGQPLFVLGTDRSTVAGDTAMLVAQSLATRRLTLQAERTTRELQARQRAQALADRLHSIQAELRQADDEKQLAEHRVALASKNLQRYQQLAKDGFVADIQAQQKQEDLIDLQTRAQAAQRNRTALLRDAQSVRAEQIASASQLETELAQLDRSLASLEQEGIENDGRRQTVITAAQDGVVTALNFKVGQAVQTGQTLATLVPGHDGQQSELEAQLYAPSKTAGFVQAGQRVWLRYAAYPYQKFGMHGGQITSVSRTPINAQDLPAGQGNALLAAAQSNEPLYRVSVKLDAQAITAYGRAQPLKPGMALEADVLQDRRAIWEWMLEPVLAASGISMVLTATPEHVPQGH